MHGPQAEVFPLADLIPEKTLKQKTNLNPWDQVAPEYEEQIISPLLHAKINPLWTRLKRCSPNSSILDLGCGTGNLLPFLVDHFHAITALDGSEQMIKAAKTKIKNLQPEKAQVNFIHSCMKELNPKMGKWDIIVAVNSLITPDYELLQNTFEKLHSCLNPQGKIFIIAPSMESIWEEFRFTYQKELLRYKGKGLAKASTRKKLDSHRIDWELGEYHTGDMAQKYYTTYELKAFLQNAGFKVKYSSQVIYRGEHSFNYHDLRNDKIGPSMWDHFFEAAKG